MSDSTPWTAPQASSPRGPGFATIFLVLSCVFALIVLGFWWLRDSVQSTVSVEPRPVHARGELPEGEARRIEVFRRSRDSVVHIVVHRRDGAGNGSGFVWDETGTIVTNAHVVAGARHIEVRSSRGDSYPARVVGFNRPLDVAVLSIRIDEGELKPLPLGRARDLDVGQAVLAIGSPFGLQQTLSVGVISALERSIGTESGTGRIEGAIQTDAAINPGNSGGPLLDSSGLVIGMNTAIFSELRQSAGVSFAIPVDRLNVVVPEILAGRSLQNGFLGISGKSYRDARGRRGVAVMGVEAGTPAQTLGLIPAMQSTGVRDIIVAVNGEPVTSLGELQDRLGLRAAGETVTLGILRDGRLLDLDVTLASR